MCSGGDKGDSLLSLISCSVSFQHISADISVVNQFIQSTIPTPAGELPSSFIREMKYSMYWWAMGSRDRMKRLLNTVELSRHFVVSDWVLFPDDPSQIFTPVLKVRLSEELHILLMGKINVYEASLTSPADHAATCHSPVKAWGVKKTSSFGAIRATLPYLRKASLIAHGCLPYSLGST